MNAPEFTWLLLAVGIVLCWLGFKVFTVLARIANSVQTMAKDHRDAVECHAVGIMAATLIAGTLANPQRLEELKALGDKHGESISAQIHEICNHAGEGRELDHELMKMLEALQKEYQQAVHNADVFTWDGRKKLIELALDTYSAAKVRK